MALGSSKTTHRSHYGTAAKAAMKHLDKASNLVNRTARMGSGAARHKTCQNAISELVNGALLVGQAEAHHMAGGGGHIDEEDQLHQELYTTDAHVGEFCTLGAKTAKKRRK